MTSIVICNKHVTQTIMRIYANCAQVNDELRLFKSGFWRLLRLQVRRRRHLVILVVHRIFLACLLRPSSGASVSSPQKWPVETKKLFRACAMCSPRE